MARTPLFDTLQRAARIARLSADTGEPLAELIDRANERRVDAARRRFLGVACGAAASLALPGRLRAAAGLVAPAPAIPNGADPVVIIGAGIAGLTAAWRLRQAGVAVQLIEANRRIGGRMLSLRRMEGKDYFPDGQVVELGGELVDSNHVRMHALVAELGLHLDDLRGGDPLAEADTWWAQGRRHSEAQLVHAFAPVAHAIERDLKAIGEGDITYATPLGAQALDALTITQWFDRHGVSGWLRNLLDVAYTTEMGLACDRQSALNLLTFIGTRHDRFRIFGESDERYHVRGGNDQVPQALAARLADAIQVDTALEALRREEGGRYVLSLRQGSASREIKATTVLLALPFTLLREVKIDLALPEAKQRAIRELKYGTNAKLMVGFQRRVWREHKANGSIYADLPFQTTWDTSRKQGGSRGILTNFVGGQHGIDIGQGSPKEQGDQLARQLEPLFPGMSDARQSTPEISIADIRMHWPSQPWARGSYACFGPGDWTSIRGAIGEPVDQLFFAGEHCAFDTQGFMEGGVETGEQAAAAILKARGVALPQDRKAAAA